MWYFAWLLGLPVAAMFAVINAMWLEMDSDTRLTETRKR
jgi:cyd operon protein YbgT